MPSSDYTPDVADVALHLRTRTRDSNGVELGTFTSATRPTDAEVTAIIADTVVNVEDDIGPDIDPRLWSSAKRIVALRAAMAVELSYFSEQVASGRSVYPTLKEEYTEDLDKLNIAIVETAEGGDVGSDAGEDTPVWGGGDLPFIPGLDSSPSGVDLREGSRWPEALGAFHEAVDQHEAATAAVLGTTTDPVSTTPSGGTIASYLRKIRDLLSGAIDVNVVSTTGGGLTNTELRATPVPVSGPATDAQIRATPIPVSSSALTDAQLRATRVPVDPGAGPFPVSVAALPLPAGAATEATLASLVTTSGSPGDAAWVSGSGSVIALLKKIAGNVGLTDTQLRATPVPVSGPLTDTQLRASAVPVSASALPLPAGASTEATLASVLTGVGAPSDAAATTTGSLIAQARRIANLLAGTLTVGGTVAVSGSVSVTGPLTDTQLRASAVPTSVASLPLPTGASTETTLAAANTALGTTADAASSTTGTVIAHLRKIRDLLNGTLTVNVGLTDTQLRASAVPVSLASVPSHPVTNAGTFAVQDALADTALGAPADAAATTTGSVIAQLRRVANLLAATLTVSGTVSISGSVAVTGPLTDTQIRATPLPISGTVTANAGTGTFAISAASLPLPTGAALDATLTGGTQQAINRGGAKGATTAATVTSTASGADHQGLDVTLYDNAGNRLGSSGTPMRTDPVGTTNQPITAASLPLPTGAATESSLASVHGSIGDTSDAASSTTGSVIAHLRKIRDLLAATLTVSVSGSVAVTGIFWQTTQPISAASLPLPTGAATETSLAALLATSGATGDAAATGTGTINAHLRSIATALAGTLTVTGGGGGVQFAEDSIHASGDLGTMALGVRKDAVTALAGTDGDYQPAIYDASGRLWVNIGTSVLPTGASTETSLAALLATAGATGDAAATGAGTLNAHLRSIAAALAGTLTVTGGGGGSQFAEDVASVGGELMTLAGAIRQDAPASTTSLDGDYSNLKVDSLGRLWVNPSGVTQPVSGVFWQSTQPVSAASLPLPTGASTETTVAAVLAVLGASADAASSTTGTLNAHLRSIAAALAGTLTVGLPAGASTAAKQPALGTLAAPSADVLSVIMPDSSATGSLTATGTLASIATLNGHASASIQITSAGVATVTFEGSVDGSTFVSLPGSKIGGTGTLDTTNAGNQTGIWQFDVAGLVAVRARVSAYTSGTVTAFMRVTRGDAMLGLDQPLPAGTNILGAVTGSGNFATTSAAASQADGHSAAIGSTTDAAASTTGSVIAQLRRIANLLAGTLTLAANQSVNVAQINGVTPLMGNGVTGTGSQRVTIASDNTPFGVNLQAATSGGWTTGRLISAATTNATSLKGSAGQLGGWYIFNANAATRYVKFYNKATAPTVGTDTPVWVIAVPAGGAANMEFTNGLAFSTGIAYATTTGIADSDNTAVAANDLVINLAYK